MKLSNYIDANHFICRILRSVILPALAGVFLSAGSAMAKCEEESQRHQEAIENQKAAESQLELAQLKLVRAQLIGLRGRGGSAELEKAKREVGDAELALERAKVESARSAEDLNSCEAEAEADTEPLPDPEPEPQPDCDDEKEARDNAAAELEEVKARQRETAAYLARTERLVEEGVVAERELERARLDDAAAKASVKTAEEKLALAEEALEGCETEKVVTEPDVAQVTIAKLPSRERVSLLLAIEGKRDKRYQLQRSLEGVKWVNLDTSVSGTGSELAWTIVASELEYKFLRYTEEEQGKRLSRGKVVIHDGGSDQEFYRVEISDYPLEKPDDATEEAAEDTGEAVEDHVRPSRR